MSLNIIILAAGKGKRMHSSLPKVMHKVGGKSMLEHVLISAKKLNPSSINVVLSPKIESIKNPLVVMILPGIVNQSKKVQLMQ